MAPFEKPEEQIRHRTQKTKAQKAEARKIAARLQEIEQELEVMAVVPTYRHEEMLVSSCSKARRPLQKMSNMGKFLLTVISVVTAICLAHWIGLTVFIMGAILAAWAGKAIVIVGVIWISYKIFLEDKD